MDNAVTATTTTASPQFPGDMVIFTEEILTENFIFCAVTFTKKGNSGVQSVIVKEGKKIFKTKEVVVKRMLINGKSNTFITLNTINPISEIISKCV